MLIIAFGTAADKQTLRSDRAFASWPKASWRAGLDSCAAARAGSNGGWPFLEKLTSVWAKRAGSTGLGAAVDIMKGFGRLLFGHGGECTHR